MDFNHELVGQADQNLARLADPSCIDRNLVGTIVLLDPNGRILDLDDIVLTLVRVVGDFLVKAGIQGPLVHHLPIDFDNRNQLAFLAVRLIVDKGSHQRGGEKERRRARPMRTKSKGRNCLRIAFISYFLPKNFIADIIPQILSNEKILRFSDLDFQTDKR